MPESYPLSWPDGWVRTRPDRRRPNNTWKKPFGAYRNELIEEIERLGAVSLTLSTNVPLTLRGLPREGFRPPDPGVAVYFSRKAKSDFTWQDVLGLGAVPTREQIEHKFRELSARYHPDKPRTGDVELFRSVVRAREAGRDWLEGKNKADHHYVLACDLFDEVRLNMHSIGLTVIAMRQIERCGASSMLERAFRGFVAALPAKGEVAS